MYGSIALPIFLSIYRLIHLHSQENDWQGRLNQESIFSSEEIDSVRIKPRII